MANKYGLELDRSWKSLLLQARTADLPDLLYWEDHKLMWPDLKKELEAALDDGTYSPQAPSIIEVPKDGLHVRPMAVLAPGDRVVYEAIGRELAPHLNVALPPEVKSMRLRRRPGGSFLQNQRRAWLGFQREGRALYEEYGYGFLLSTDVSSYFEYVEIPILMRELQSLPGCDRGHLQLLSRLLNEIVRSSDVWGLPQGPTTSSLLGNFYLLPVDRVLRRYPVKFLRYQDDIKVFGQAPTKLRAALQEITRVLRSRHLNLSVHKTRILSGREILDEFEDAEKDAIQYGLQVGDPRAPKQLRKLFDDAVRPDSMDARDIRFTVYRLAKSRDPHAVPWILKHLASVPFLASHLVRYLGEFFATMPEIEQEVATYLANPDENLYPWTEMQLLRMLARAEAISDDTYEVVLRILRDLNKEPFVREQAARCAGRHSRPGEAALLRALFSGEPSIAVRRALLVAVTEADGEPDPAWLATVARTHPEHKHTSKFLKSGAVIPEP